MIRGTLLARCCDSLDAGTLEALSKETHVKVCPRLLGWDLRVVESVRYAVVVDSPHHPSTIGRVRRTGRASEGDHRLLIGTDALATRVTTRGSRWMLACGWLVDVVGDILAPYRLVWAVALELPLGQTVI